MKRWRWAAVALVLLWVGPADAFSTRSVRFYGTGGDTRVDRIKVRVDPPTPADVGAGDFTIEMWVRGTLADNVTPNNGFRTQAEVSSIDWIYGNIIIDRDLWGDGPDWGMSIHRDSSNRGILRFGTEEGPPSFAQHTLQGRLPVLDGAWHHVAFVRERSTGVKRIYVDGVLDVASALGVSTTDLSYPNGRSPSSDSDPFLVFAAEKHGYGRNSGFPSFSGWMDDIRVWNVARTGAQIDANRSVSLAPNTPGLVLYLRLEEGAGTALADATGGNAGAATLYNGVSGNGEWRTELPPGAGPSTTTSSTIPTTSTSTSSSSTSTTTSTSSSTTRSTTTTSTSSSSTSSSTSTTRSTTTTSTTTSSTSSSSTSTTTSSTRPTSSTVSTTSTSSSTTSSSTSTSSTVTAPVPTTTTTIASATGPVAAWALNEGAGGSVGDSTGRGNDGTVVGATWRPQGRWGAALGFDGDDYVSVPDGADLDETSALTIEAWVNPAQVSGYRMVVAKTSSGTPMNYYLGLSGREVEFGFFSGGAWRWHTTSGVNLAAGTWAHVAVVYNDAADTVRLYVNGVQRLAATETGSLTVNTQPLRIGLGYPNDGFIGDIDEVRVYQRALSASEIATDMNAPVGGGATPTTSTSTTSSSSSSSTAAVPSTTSTSRSTTTTSSSSTSSSSSSSSSTTSTTSTSTTSTSSTSTTSTSSTSSTTSTTIPADLVGGWGFEEGTGGVAFDQSGFENDASITGAVFTPSGRFGGALSFDGNADWLTVADAASLDLTSEMTLEAWVYPTATGTVARPIVGKERPSNAAWFLNAATAGNSNPSVAVRVGTSNVSVTAGAPLPVNWWTHLAATYDGSSLRLYVNGTLAGERATSGVLATSSRPLRVGHNDVNGGVFLGRIDDVRVYARALTAEEILADMARPVP